MGSKTPFSEPAPADQGPAALDAAFPFEANEKPSENPHDLLNEGRLTDVLRFSRVLEYRSGEQIIVGGAESRCLYYVEKGSVEVSYRVADTPILVALIGPSSFFGEIGFFDRVSRVRDIRTAENSVIRFFDNESVVRMRNEEPLDRTTASILTISQYCSP